VKEDFRKLYGSAEGWRVFRAPGAVNLIASTPTTTSASCCGSARSGHLYRHGALTDGKLRIYSEFRKEMREWNASEIARSLRAALDDYPIGVAQELLCAGLAVAPPTADPRHGAGSPG